MPARLIIILFFFLSMICKAQDYYKLKPTKFDSFITSSKISWAQRINAKYFFKPTNFNLWDYLMQSWQNNVHPIFYRDSVWQYHKFDSVENNTLNNEIIDLKKIILRKHFSISLNRISVLKLIRFFM